MTTLVEKMADYLAKHVFVNEDCDQSSCELANETGPCLRTCSMYRIDCLGHAKELASVAHTHYGDPASVTPEMARIIYEIEHDPCRIGTELEVRRYAFAAAMKTSAKGKVT